jgi:hypothetical protein
VYAFSGLDRESNAGVHATAATMISTALYIFNLTAI